MGIWDPGTGWKKFGSGMEKILILVLGSGIRDKHPGSATPRISVTNFAVWQVSFVIRKLILNFVRKVLKVGLKNFRLKGTPQFYVKLDF
jgi:hypothetical protein